LFYVTRNYATLFIEVHATRLLFVDGRESNDESLASLRIAYSPRPTTWRVLRLCLTTYCIIRYLARSKLYTLVLPKAFCLPIPFAATRIMLTF